MSMILRKKLLFIFGTRPEAIKMAPLILAAREMKEFRVTVCVTGQHREMLRQVLDFFGIRPSYDIDVMTHNQSLPGVTSGILTGLERVMARAKPDLVLVQGDTTTAFTGALSAFYHKIPVAHIEAGLRSGMKHSPYPEEINRILVAGLADYHFAPTAQARENLLSEGIDSQRIYIVGNTVIDALFLALHRVETLNNVFSRRFAWAGPGKKMILVTGHRRESFGEPFRDICAAIREIARMKDVEIVYPVHLNPHVRKPVFEILSDCPNVHLIEPMPYPELVWLMERSYLILTDSGGIQEEAPSIGKPVLVMREVTERTEGIAAGTAKLVGTSREKIVAETRRLFTRSDEYEKMARAVNPYGDGRSSARILKILAGVKR
jgi:UDP-N-acetylglucosamine 2-epimerase (non-hydrolysing)